MTTVHSLTTESNRSAVEVTPGTAWQRRSRTRSGCLPDKLQFGELTGADAGTPAQVAFQQTETGFDGWKPGGGTVLPYSPQSDVVEALVAGEAAGPAHSTLDRLEAGRALVAAVSSAVAAQLRTAFPLQVADDSPRLLARGHPCSPTDWPSPRRSPAPPVVRMRLSPLR